MRKTNQNDTKRRNDIFQSMEKMQNRMLSNFNFQSNFRNSLFGSPFENRLQEKRTFGFDIFDDIFCDNNVGIRGNYVCQSYSSKTVIALDGNSVTEKMVKNESSKIGQDGMRINEKNEMYNHTGKNIKRLVRERRLGDQTLKVTREINKNDYLQYRDMHNLNEDEIEAFNTNWNQKAHNEELLRPSFGHKKGKTQGRQNMIGNK